MNEMRKLMEALDSINENEVVEIDVSNLDLSNEDDANEFYGKFQSTDWKEASDEVFEQMAHEVAQYGLKVYLANIGDDSFHWYVGK